MIDRTIFYGGDSCSLLSIMAFCPGLCYFHASNFSCWHQGAFMCPELIYDDGGKTET